MRLRIAMTSFKVGRRIIPDSMRQVVIPFGSELVGLLIATLIPHKSDCFVVLDLCSNLSNLGRKKRCTLVSRLICTSCCKRNLRGVRRETETRLLGRSYAARVTVRRAGTLTGSSGHTYESKSNDYSPPRIRDCRRMRFCGLPSGC